ncbi:MAG: DUF111 family protein [Bacillota bacterium]|nr:DUF111 family protein [Bacillota bacterium]
MRTLYFDLTSGVSGDMVLNGLIGLCDNPQNVRRQIAGIEEGIDVLTAVHRHSYAHHHDPEEGDHHHGHRSYARVQEIIRNLDLAPVVQEKALNIYSVIAAAESQVHEAPLDDLHFHEVGRTQAIANIVGAAFCINDIGAGRLLCSEICDGQGKVQCAHGVLEVPVPAVRAMLKDCALPYRQTEHEGEMVTPSGLAMIIGLGFDTADRPKGTPVRESEAKGRRVFGEKGLMSYLFDTQE